MLAAMFDPESERPPARKDGQGNFFLDRDPGPFEVILSFLRSARLVNYLVFLAVLDVYLVPTTLHNISFIVNIFDIIHLKSHSQMSSELLSIFH